MIVPSRAAAAVEGLRRGGEGLKGSDGMEERKEEGLEERKTRKGGWMRKGGERAGGYGAEGGEDGGKEGEVREKEWENGGK